MNEDNISIPEPGWMPGHSKYDVPTQPLTEYEDADFWDMIKAEWDWEDETDACELCYELYEMNPTYSECSCSECREKGE